jgi:hypothetical protein
MQHVFLLATPDTQSILLFASKLSITEEINMMMPIKTIVARSVWV